MTIEKRTANGHAGFPVAVVGLHGRFPAAGDAQTFWENLRDGRDAITTIPPERWDHAALFGEPDGAEERTYATTGGFMPHVDCFDSGFFNILPREAESMDPQQRLFLQTAWQALEDAGYPPKELAGKRVGVFAGVGHADYPVLMRRDGAPFDVFRATGIVPTAIANRVSFSLDLRGPSESIDTACSGSLVAIHRAIQAMEAGECELAIAGGVNLLLGPELFIAFAKAGMLSRSGRCRVLDAGSDGYVRGEGVAALVLRPLGLAVAEGDFIYGVIRGSAENHGGKTHSFTAPGVGGQADVITRAWTRAGLSVQDASLMEMHGTGTPLGDPIEVRGLKKAFEEAKRGADAGTAAVTKVALGALKSHVGHLEAAAGIGGVIKTLLSMQNGLIPPNLHYRQLNPQIDLQGTPFFVPIEPVPFGADLDHPSLAGVSSFGFGGVNAHVVIEAYRHAVAPRSTLRRDTDESGPYLFVISAREEKALSRRVEQLLTFLDSTGPSQPPSQTINIRRVSDALGLGALAGACGGIRLDSLDLSEGRLILALRRLNGAAGRRVGIHDVRDCVTVADLAKRIDAILDGTGDAASFASRDEPGLPRVAVASDTLRRTSLDTISYSLMHGRDTMRERLAVVTGSKAALVAALRGFLAEPHAPRPGLTRGSILSPQNASAPEPALMEGSASADILDEWARYWVSNRSAKLRWSSLHRGDTPARVPLPAYPFELKRIWYTARDLQQSATTMPEQTPDRNVPVELPLPGPTGHPVSSSRSPSVAVPESLTGLACLLEHLLATRGNNSIHLSHIDFGEPLEARGRTLVCRSGGRGQTEIVQCLYDSGPPPHVLLQARLTGAIKAASQSGRETRHGMNSLQPMAVYSVAGRNGLTVAPEHRCIDAVEAAPQALAMKISLSRLTTTDVNFWPSLFSSVLAGSAYLQLEASLTHPNSNRLCLYRVSTLTFDPQSARAVTDITIERDKTNGSMNVIVRGSDGGHALELRGLQLREVPASSQSGVAATTPTRTALAS